MKKLIVGIALFSLLGICHADDGDGHGNDKTGPQGPQGIAGQNGTNGANGKDGQNGQNGVNGKDGQNGKDVSAGFRGTDLAADVAVRLVDTKYFQLQVFDQYVFGSTMGSDVFGDGHNQTIGARIVIKLGSSYEERLLEKQQKEIDLLLSKLRKK